MQRYLFPLLIIFCACQSREAARKRVTAAADSAEAADSLRPGMGKWVVDSTTDPATAKQVIRASLQSTVERGQDTHAATLDIRCSADSVGVSIAWGKDLGANTFVSMRVDGLAAGGVNWGPSESKTVTNWPSGDPFIFVTQLARGQKFVATIESANSGNLTAVFELRGIERAVEPIGHACGKSLDQ